MKSSAPIALLLLALSPLTATGSDQIIVKFKTTSSGKVLPMTADRLKSVAASAGQAMHFKRTMGTGGKVFKLSRGAGAAETQALLEQLNQRDDVEYAELDLKRYPAAFPATTPNDPDYGNQWYLHSSSLAGNAGATNVETAWNSQLVTGAGITIAVIDTGYTPHSEWGGNIINGPDFISRDMDGSTATAGDGNGRDSDGEDAGDIVTEEDKNNLPTLRDDPNCNISSASSWHGTMVAGVIAAQADNSSDIAGIAPSATVLSVRALGKCGGYNSDIIDAALWAAGLHTSNFAAPSTPAQVINLSLGGGGSCSRSEQDAFDAIVASGAVVVTAAGNEGGDADNSGPGNCNKTINVAASTRQGGETDYTNIGNAIDLSAPGGNTSSCVDAIITTTQNIPTAPEGGWGSTTSNSTLTCVQGTSFAAPIVSASIALMLERNPALTPNQIYGTLLDNVRSFPQGTADGFRDCAVGRCGEGLLDTAAAVAAANSPTSRPFPNKTQHSSSGGGGGGNWSPLALPLLLLALLIRRRRPQ